MEIGDEVIVNMELYKPLHGISATVVGFHLNRIVVWEHLEMTYRAFHPEYLVKREDWNELS